MPTAKKTVKDDWSKLEAIVRKIKEAQKDPEFRAFIKSWNKIAMRTT